MVGKSCHNGGEEQALLPDYRVRLIFWIAEKDSRKRPAQSQKCGTHRNYNVPCGIVQSRKLNAKAKPPQREMLGPSVQCPRGFLVVCYIQT